MWFQNYLWTILRIQRNLALKGCYHIPARRRGKWYLYCSGWISWGSFFYLHIISFMFFSNTIIISIIIPDLQQALLLFYYCFIIVSLLLYHCFIIVLSLLHYCFIIAPLLFYYCFFLTKDLHINGSETKARTIKSLDSASRPFLTSKIKHRNYKFKDDVWIFWKFHL